MFSLVECQLSCIVRPAYFNLIQFREGVKIEEKYAHYTYVFIIIQNSEMKLDLCTYIFMTR